MPKNLKTLVAAAALIGGLLAAPALYAQDTGRMMGGMMRGGGMGGGRSGLEVEGRGRGRENSRFAFLSFF